MKKHLTALLLAVLLTFSVIPAVSAAEADETETAQISEPVINENVPTDPGQPADPEISDEIEVAEKIAPAETAADYPAEELAETADNDIPKITRVNPSEGGATVKWTAFNGAAKYFVFTEKTGGGWKKIGESTSLSFEHKNPTFNTPYKYTVRAADKNGNFISGFDKEGYTFTCLATPTLTSVENINNGQQIKWQAVDGAVLYLIYVKGSAGWEEIELTDSTSYKYYDLTPGKKYTYTVRCWDPETHKVQSFYDRKGVSGVYIAPPQITGFSPVKGGVTVKWNVPEGASRFSLFVKSGAKWKKLCNTTDNSYTHTGLSADTTYTYTVRCIDKNGNFVSGYNTKGFDYRCLANPSFSSITAADNGTLLKWKTSPYAAAYRIYRKTFKGSWACIGVSATGEFTDTNIAKNTLYTYTLRGIDENGNLITHFADTGIYYYNSKLANGNIKVGNSTFHFEKGKLYQGFVTTGGKTYYYGSNGTIQKNGIVGSKKDGWTYADKNGVCNTDKQTREAATFMMTYCKGNTLKEKAKYAFMYIADNYEYVRVYNDNPEDESDLPAFASELFEGEGGTCYRYASAYAYICAIAGYRVRFIYGMSSTLYHGWNEVYVDGEWLICDVDANIPSFGNEDYAAYMMDEHIWSISKFWRSELTLKNGKATWSSIVEY